jgi:hypothetical protein
LENVVIKYFIGHIQIEMLQLFELLSPAKMSPRLNLAAGVAARYDFVVTLKPVIGDGYDTPRAPFVHNTCSFYISTL